jgi:hypothetical protein
LACIALCALVSRCWFNSACVCMFCSDGFSLAFSVAFVAFAMRAIAAACARFGAPPPWFPETGCNGVLVPVLVSDDGGTMFPGESRSSEGICGSDGIDPSFCRSRSLMSSRFTWRSNYYRRQNGPLNAAGTSLTSAAAFSESPIFSSCSTCERS